MGSLDCCPTLCADSGGPDFLLVSGFTTSAHPRGDGILRANLMVSLPVEPGFGAASGIDRRGKEEDARSWCLTLASGLRLTVLSSLGRVWKHMGRLFNWGAVGLGVYL